MFKFNLGFAVCLSLSLSLSLSLDLSAGSSSYADAKANDDSHDLHASQANGDYEPAVLSIVTAIQAGRLSDALSLADVHIDTFPKSRVGHLLRADILKAMSEPLRQIGGGVVANSDVNTDALAGFTHQLRNRWQHSNQHLQTVHTKYPSGLLDMGQHEHVIVADMPAGRLYLYENANGRPKLIRDYYMSVGSAGYGKEVEGDNKTPIGVYEVNRYIEGRALPDLYGKGAFPVNYPNRFDRFRKRTGYGIWLHGTPSDTYARSPFASEGCFVLSNDDLLDIGNYINIEKRTPVILSDSVEWISAEQLDAQKQSYRDLITKWKTDWESLDTQAYLRHYSQENFNFGSGDFRSWADRKHQINLGKTFVQVDIELKSLFIYPGEKDMFIATYTQRYLSNNFSGETNKQQYWQRNAAGQWQIIYEG